MSRAALSPSERCARAVLSANRAESWARAEGERLGLVPSSTSDTRPAYSLLLASPDHKRLTIELDRNAIRAKRLKKAVITGARLHDQEAKEGGNRGAWYMLTLTYGPGRSASPRDVSELLKRIRGHFNRTVRSRVGRHSEVFRYLWVLELTQSLRPHYHLLMWVPRGFYVPHVDRRGWWPHGLTKFEKARNAVGYLAKYASKFCGAAADALPKGFRTHAVGGLGDESRREMRWWKSPEEARQFLGPLADIRKVLGGYADKLTGLFWPSPWRVLFLNGRTFAWRLVPV